MHDCCKRSLLAGMLVFSGVCTRERIRFVTENKNVAALYSGLLTELYEVDSNLYVSEKKTPPEGEDEEKKLYESYKITIPERKQIAKMSLLFVSGNSLYHINPDLFSCPLCRATFVRGVFLASGNVTDPDRCYHLEISCAYRNLAYETLTLLKELSLEPKLAMRKTSYILYYKKAETVIDFLNTVGATKSGFDYINQTIKKDSINSVNRAVNCDTANIQKAVTAASEAIDAINYLKDTGKLQSLPPELYSTAALRLENPDMTLKQLSEVSPEPISKSGINHRLKKIIDFANQYR